MRRKVRHQWVNDLFGLRPGASSTAVLRRLGVAQGDAVMVHSSFDRFEGFQGSLRDAMQVLQDAVGDEGALLMPTLPVLEHCRGLRANECHSGHQAHALAHGLHDRDVSAACPACAGACIRRTPWPDGEPRAARLLDGHQSARTPCGAGSPFEKLVEADGKVILLGVNVRTMTFFHYLEEELGGTDALQPLHERDGSL